MKTPEQVEHALGFEKGHFQLATRPQILKFELFPTSQYYLLALRHQKKIHGFRTLLFDAFVPSESLKKKRDSQNRGKMSPKKYWIFRGIKNSQLCWPCNQRTILREWGGGNSQKPFALFAIPGYRTPVIIRQKYRRTGAFSFEILWAVIWQI